MSSVLIVGGGISGCAAALELAGQGHDVRIVEAAGRAGGKILSYCCKATTECMRCGVCVAHTVVADALACRRVTLHAAARVTGVSEAGKRLDIAVERRNPAITHACRQCDRCIGACPAGCISRHSRGGLTQYAIDHSRCLRARGRQCRKCIQACPDKAISGSGVSETMRFAVDAALVATGHDAFNPACRPTLGFGRLEGVLTGEQAEEILSRQLWLRKPAEDVAFVQCVGSRDPSIGRNYCSSVCCAYASRMARVLKSRDPAARATVYFIDLQNFDKNFTGLRAAMEKEGVEFVRAVPSDIEPAPGNKLRVLIEGADGRQGRAEHDTVVLSVGMGPAAGSDAAARLFGLERDAFGFFSGASRPNVFVTGTCASPRSIIESITSARASVANMLQVIPRGVKKPADPVLRGVKTRIEKTDRRVLVAGGGAAGLSAAAVLQALGHPVTLVEKGAQTRGTAAAWKRVLAGAAPGRCPIDVLTNAELADISGRAGRFTAGIQSAAGSISVGCGAIILCTGVVPPRRQFVPAGADNVMALSALPGFLAKSPARHRPGSVAILLDMFTEETRASTEWALNTALAVRGMYGAEVCIACRDVRVAAPGLEELYGRARAAGVNVVKYTGRPEIAAGEDAVRLVVRDSLLGEQVDVECGLLAVSEYGLDVAADRRLAEAAGVGLDAEGLLQADNAHLFPALTNRPGIFAVGSCRGSFYVPEILESAEAAALAAHSLLGGGSMTVRLDNAVVDAQKCALCLTCVRCCPYGAMIVDEEKRSAVSQPEVCRRCGICVGECPAGAIELN